MKPEGGADRTSSLYGAENGLLYSSRGSAISGSAGVWSGRIWSIRCILKSNACCIQCSKICGLCTVPAVKENKAMKNSLKLWSCVLDPMLPFTALLSLVSSLPKAATSASAKSVATAHCHSSRKCIRARGIHRRLVLALKVEVACRGSGVVDKCRTSCECITYTLSVSHCVDFESSLRRIVQFSPQS